jgi:hypothetical protein
MAPAESDNQPSLWVRGGIALFVALVVATGLSVITPLAARAQLPPCPPGWSFTLCSCPGGRTLVTSTTVYTGPRVVGAGNSVGVGESVGAGDRVEVVVALRVQRRIRNSRGQVVTQGSTDIAYSCVFVFNPRLTIVLPPGSQPTTTGGAPGTVTTQPEVPVTQSTTIATTTTTTIAPVKSGVAVSPVDFGPVPIGKTSAPRDAVVTHGGNVPVRFSSFATEGPFATVSGGTCDPKVSLVPGATCTIKVTYTPTAGTPQTGSLRIAGTSAAGDQVFVGALSGSGSAAGLVFEPSTLSLGSGWVGQAASGSLALRNVGSSSVTVIAIGIVGPPGKAPKKSKKPPAPSSVPKLGPLPKDFNLDIGACVGKVLSPGATCAMNLLLTPPAAGQRSVRVEARGSGNVASRATINRLAAVPDLLLSPASADFTGKAGKSTTFTVTNRSKLPVKLKPPTLAGGDAALYSIVSTTCSPTKPLAIGKSCAVLVRSSATGGSRRANLVVALNEVTFSRQSELVFGQAPTVPPTNPPTLPITVSPSTTTAPVVSAPPTVVFSPTLRMSPAVGTAGRVATAIGAGFPPDTSVTLKWDNLPEVWTVKTDSAGAFNVAILVKTGEPIGGRRMTVTSPSAHTNVSAPFLVQLATFRPPGGNGQNDRMVSRG